VLVIEDDLDTRDLIQRLLESHRAGVVVAATAPEALEVLQRDRPDMIVSDIGLPDVDGYELIRRIRRLEDPIANTPAVALTAFARYEDRTRALGAGFNAHVAKPVEPSELVITVGSFANLIATRRK
jgi:CheY-like chemotaxis protein